MKGKLCIGAVLVLLMQPGGLLAHHSFTAEYDSRRPVSVAGVVSKVEWTNPHVWIHVAVRGEDGQVTTWRFWEDSPAILARKGIERGVLSAGDRVKVYGFQARDGSPRATAGRVTFEDGRKVFEAIVELPIPEDS